MILSHDERFPQRGNAKEGRVCTYSRCPSGNAWSQSVLADWKPDSQRQLCSDLDEAPSSYCEWNLQLRPSRARETFLVPRRSTCNRWQRGIQEKCPRTQVWLTVPTVQWCVTPPSPPKSCYFSAKSKEILKYLLFIQNNKIKNNVMIFSDLYIYRVLKSLFHSQKLLVNFT